MSRETPNDPPSARQRLLAAHEALLDNHGLDAERMVNARLQMYAAYADMAMIEEAAAQLDLAEREAALVGSSRQREIVANQTVLALLVGDYASAARLVASETSLDSKGDQSTGWARVTEIHRFLLRREQGRPGEAGEGASLEELPPNPLQALSLVLLNVSSGPRDHVQLAFKRLARDGFGLRRADRDWSLGIAMASEACAALSDTTLADELYAALLPVAGGLAVSHPSGSGGPFDRYLGLLAATLGRSKDAEQHLEASIRISERMGAWPWIAHSKVDLAKVLTRRGQTGDLGRARELVADAEAVAKRLGMAGLLDGELRVVEVASSARRKLPGAAASSITTSVFRREGEYWTVSYAGATFSMRDTKGMQYLARLLAAPNREIHVLHLVADGKEAGDRHLLSAPAASGLPASGIGDAGELLDQEAREQYRSRLQELDEDIAEAESFNDPIRVERLQSERDFLIRELTAAVGLGGRSRVAASAAERARLNVSKTTRSAIDRIETHHKQLGRHLKLSVHTGTFCSYRPDPATEVVWEL